MRTTLLVLQDAVASMLMRPGKVFLTAFGAMMGVASLVAIVGLTSTATAQIVQRFDAAATTQVTVQVPVEALEIGTEPPIDWSSERNVLALNGVEAATSVTRLDAGIEVTSLDIFDPMAAESSSTPVVAASLGFVDALGVHVVQGRTFDTGHLERADRVVLVGARAADRLGLADLQRDRVVFLDSQPYRVLGIFDSPGEGSEYLDTVVVPYTVGAADHQGLFPDRVVIRTLPGAAPTVAEQAPLSLSPTRPDGLLVDYTAEPTALREQVSGDTQALFVVVGVVSLLGGAVGIANTMLVSVLERRHEIGVRRAVGARRIDVIVQFMAESAVLGFMGGVMGTSVGAIVIVAASWLQGWTPTASVWLFGLGVALGSATGILAGIFPSWRASRIEPAASLRAA